MREPRGKPLKQRLLERVKIDPDTGCWVWTRRPGKLQYGVLSVYEAGRWRSRNAHKLSYECFVGPVPEGLSVLHRCDHKPCINPEHLELGTRSKNARDARDRLGLSKLTRADVVVIKRRLIEGDTLCAIGEAYGVSYQAIGRIKRGYSWSDVSAEERINADAR